MGPEVPDGLVQELNRAAWTGDRTELDRLLGGLPDPVAQACNQALERCPEPDSAAMGFDGRPMTVLRELSFSGSSSDLVRQAEAAMELGLQFVVENSIDEEGRLEFTAKLLSDEYQVESVPDWTWWPKAASEQLVERL